MKAYENNFNDYKNMKKGKTTVNSFIDLYELVVSINC